MALGQCTAFHIAHMAEDLGQAVLSGASLWRHLLASSPNNQDLEECNLFIYSCCSGPPMGHHGSWRQAGVLIEMGCSHDWQIY